MKAVEELQAKLNAVMEELDFKVFRPAQVCCCPYVPDLPSYTFCFLLCQRQELLHPTMILCCFLIPSSRNTGRTQHTKASYLYVHTLTPADSLSMTQKSAFQCSAKCCDLRGSQAEMQQWCVRTNLDLLFFFFFRTPSPNKKCRLESLKKKCPHPHPSILHCACLHSHVTELSSIHPSLRLPSFTRKRTLFHPSFIAPAFIHT